MSYRFLKFEQRSPQWHEWRLTRITASEAAIIMGVSPYATPHVLWMRKKGLIPPQPDNPGMARGRALEDEAIALYNAETGNMVAPACIERTEAGLEWMAASLDGLDIFGTVLCEAKAPNLQDHELAIQGEIPEKYWPQLQHQLACKPDAEVNHYWSYRPGHDQPTALVEVYRDEAYIAEMIEKEKAFYESLQGDTPPGGGEWADLESAYLAALAHEEEAKAAVKEIKDALIAAVPEGHQKGEGERVSVSLSKPGKGSVNYRKALDAVLPLLPDEELERFDLDAYRNAPSKPSWRVTVKKPKDSESESTPEKETSEREPAIEDGRFRPGF